MVNDEGEIAVRGFIGSLADPDKYISAGDRSASHNLRRYICIIIHLVKKTNQHVKGTVTPPFRPGSVTGQYRDFYYVSYAEHALVAGDGGLTTT